MQQVGMAEGKDLEAIDNDRLFDRPLGALDMEQKQGVTPEPRGETHDGGGGTAGLAGDLAVAGAGEQPVGDLLEKLGALEVVGGGEGLRAERGAAVTTAEAGNAPGVTLAGEEAVADPSPADWGTVEEAM